MENENHKRSHSYILGQAMARLERIQQYLIDGEDQKVRGAVNEAMRVLNELVKKAEAPLAIEKEVQNGGE